MPAGPAGPELRGPDTPDWDAGAGVVAARALLSMEGPRRATLERAQVAAWLGRRLNETWTLRLIGGGIIGGQWRGVGGDARVDGGWIAGASVSRSFADGGGAAPWVRGTATLAVARYDLRGPYDVWAGDLRLGVEAGWQLGPLTPYVLGRVFGGPVMRDTAAGTLSGTDRTHVQVGPGVAAKLGPVGVGIEASVWGEVAVAASVSARF